MGKKKTNKTARRGGGGLQDFVSEASGRFRKTVQEAVSTLEKRRDSEIKNLRGRMRDLDISVGGLERRYRTLEKRVEKQLARRGVNVGDVEKRVRDIEAELRRRAGLAPRKVAAKRPAAGAKGPARRKRRTTKRRAAMRKARTTTTSATGPSATTSGRAGGEG